MTSVPQFSHLLNGIIVAPNAEGCSEDTLESKSLAQNKHFRMIAVNAKNNDRHHMLALRVSEATKHDKLPLLSASKAISSKKQFPE